MPGTWPWPGRRPKGSRWCSARPRRRWRAGTGRGRASTRWWRCRGGCWTGRCRAVGTIDLRGQKQSGGLARGAISRQMHAAVSAALDEGGQVILLLNRRGFSTHIQCPACGHVMQCPQCDIALTHHRTEAIALCHYCDYEVPAPTACPACRLRRHPLLGSGHATAGGRGAGPISQRHGAADGYRHDAGPRQPRAGAGGVSRGQGPHPAGHADDRQGIGFSQRHAGRA